MAIMAMGMAKKPNSNFKIKVKIKVKIILSITLLPSMVFAGDWRFEPDIGITETYSDNVLLRAFRPASSLVSQATAALNTNYLSSRTNFNFLASKSYLNYSHNKNLNDDYRTLETDVEYSLWKNGPLFIATGAIDNIARNVKNNAAADFISGGTIEVTSYSTGLKYNVGNTSYSVNSSLIFNNVEYEDGIANSHGFTGSIDAVNGNSARLTFWQFSGYYLRTGQGDFNDNTIYGENYTIDAKIGAITSFALNPFVRVYNEKVEGGLVGLNQQTTPSWGPGLRWKVSRHLVVDMSYNFVQDDTISDDYIDAQLNWQPSSRTSLVAGFSQRFFGNSYNLDFQHRTKRLTNSISYSENLEAFDRNNFTDPSPIIPGLPPTDSKEFSLLRSLAWTSNLQFTRTLFTVKINGYEREALESGTKDDTFTGGVSITRSPSPKSEFALSADYQYSIFDKENPNGASQEDYYRTYSASYTRNLASSLYSSITLRHINRDSNILRFTYKEVRVMLNITKDF